ncbi:nucleoside hydrolase [Streptantibioticus ferralitis]|uniref:Nucleoside hydrolase n=1 Tax=Streptantibioticus ferralitis TaxID=236510 RepID=A0ABT5Z6M9_9ACTN|nr:nucleoside hydrolase [Streptantibioticus ferralitis]MDF2259492.1 nucleoside hydrolase [Streptantibioticus ferralitis]
MGESNDDDRTVSELREEWRRRVELGEMFPEFQAASEQLRKAPWPEDLRNAPLIIDTDIGGDADDALAVAVAARKVPLLSLVITADETGPAAGPGQRARFARWLLDAIGRPEVPVVSGKSVGDTEYWCVDGLVPETVPAQSVDVVAAVRHVCASTAGPVRWVGMGPLGNLATVLQEAPELASRLRVTQMGGALNYRHPDRAEHNIRLNVPAAHQVLDAVAKGVLPKPGFVTSDITFTPAIAVGPDSAVYRALAAPGAPQWAAILRAHLDRWFERFYPDTLQHDALTLSAALRLPFVDSILTPVVLDEIGRMTSPTNGGVPVMLSREANYEAFMRWFTQALDPTVSTEHAQEA